jgi:hypothetical protein
VKVAGLMMIEPDTPRDRSPRRNNGLMCALAEVPR